MKRLPWLTGLMRLTLKVTQAHYTAGVVGVILNDRGEVLLVEHVFHPERAWGLPGGWLDQAEAPAAALAREVREETGIRVEIIRPLVIDQGFYSKSHLDIAYLCRAENEVQRLSGELLDYRWASFESLPPMLPFHEAAVTAAQSWREKEGVGS